MLDILLREMYGILYNLLAVLRLIRNIAERWGSRKDIISRVINGVWIINKCRGAVLL